MNSIEESFEFNWGTHMGAWQECVISYSISHLSSRKNIIPFAFATLAKIIHFVNIFVHLNAYLLRKLKSELTLMSLKNFLMERRNN